MSAEAFAAQAMAARAAVELFEAERMAASAERKKQKEEWAQNMVTTNIPGLAEDLRTIASAVNLVSSDDLEMDFHESDMDTPDSAASATVEQMKVTQGTTAEDDEVNDFEAYDPDELDFEALGAAVEDMDAAYKFKFITIKDISIHNTKTYIPLFPITAIALEFVDFPWRRKRFSEFSRPKVFPSIVCKIS